MWAKAFFTDAIMLLISLNDKDIILCKSGTPIKNKYIWRDRVS